MKRGIYFLANDPVRDLTAAFLESLRCHNPDIPVCLIPFGADTTEIRRWASRFNFSIYPDAAFLRYCDEIGGRFFPQGAGQFRKLAIWHGPFEEFIYVDVDTVVLTELDFVFDLMREWDVVTSHSNLQKGIKWVWQDSIRETGLLTPAQIAYAANTGFIASRKGVIGIEAMDAGAAEAERLLPHMVTMCMEQSFLNYLIVTNGCRHTSLSALHAEQGNERIPQEQWAGEAGGVVDGGSIRFPGRPGPLMVHWAGVWQPRGWEREFYGWLRKCGLRRKGGVQRQLPYRALWDHYRLRARRRRASDVRSA